MRECVSNLPLLRPVIEERMQAAIKESEGHAAPPWLPRPCCGLPMPIDFEQCCAIYCDSCAGLSSPRTRQ